MKKIHTIMAAIDFSDHSLSFAQCAAGLAGDIDAGVILASVLNKRGVDQTYRSSEDKIEEEYRCRTTKPLAQASV